jgi:hypothetical protein
MICSWVSPYIVRIEGYKMEECKWLLIGIFIGWFVTCLIVGISDIDRVFVNLFQRITKNHPKDQTLK